METRRKINFGNLLAKFVARVSLPNFSAKRCVDYVMTVQETISMCNLYPYLFPFFFFFVLQPGFLLLNSRPPPTTTATTIRMPCHRGLGRELLCCLPMLKFFHDRASQATTARTQSTVHVGELAEVSQSFKTYDIRKYT